MIITSVFMYPGDAFSHPPSERKENEKNYGASTHSGIDIPKLSSAASSTADI